MLNRTLEPEISFDSDIKEIEYNSHILSNSIPIYSIPDASQSVVGIQVIFEGGKVSEAVKGVSFFSTNLLKSGTKTHSVGEINDFFEFRGAFVNVQSGLDYNTINLYCLSEKLKETLPLFIELFSDSLFPEEQLEKLKKKKIQEISVNQKKSNFWANKLLKESLFKNHSYGHLISLENIEKIDRSAVQYHWDNFSASKVKFITLAGNFEADFVFDSFSKLTSTKSNNVQVVVPKTEIPDGIIGKELSQSEQTSLKIGQRIISLTHKDYPALTLGNTLWGGYFGSRLMQTIREEKGLTYGIRSSLVHLENASYLQLSADLKKGAGIETIELINAELDKLVTGNIDIEEIEKVKHYIIGEYKSSVESIFDKISKIKFIKLHGLDDSFFINLYQNILGLDTTQVQQILANHIDPHNFHTVLVE